MKEVVIVTGAGQISLAIARRIGAGKHLVIGDKKIAASETMAQLLLEAGFEATALEVDVASRTSIQTFLYQAQQYGPVKYFINGAGVSPSQASIEMILQVDLYGTAVLLEEVGKMIATGGAGVTIASQSGHRLPALSAELDAQLACTPVEELLALPALQPMNIRDSLHAYQLAKRGNSKRAMAEALKWGARGARLNAISPGIIVTPLALDEFKGPRGAFYQEMFQAAPAGRPGTADEVANVAELLFSEKGHFITGADFLVDGGATAAYFYGTNEHSNQ